MRAFVKNFLMRGLLAMGFGPIVLVIVYAILNSQNIIETLSVGEVNLAIISTLLIAFIEGSTGAIFQIENLSLGKATLIQSLLIYFTLLILYGINSWINFEPVVLLIFTIVYWIGYGIIWLIIFSIIKNSVQKVNKKL
ncbi:DUF3021 domain-containing protein [Lactobacillus sp.]|uniref:DUF3021 domain-containing protein n=1 Tax=Lactobacillus sp. TaxID=1591 RepID=UPI00199E5203|nr:DUF3021 domain-containing protein [Lactobacillus sp.]MBD5429984.1 DUF3021 domain-containing protein [Lactobacillus sp.]